MVVLVVVVLLVADLVLGLVLEVEYVLVDERLSGVTWLLRLVALREVADLLEATDDLP